MPMFVRSVSCKVCKVQVEQAITYRDYYVMMTDGSLVVNDESIAAQTAVFLDTLSQRCSHAKGAK